MSYSKVLQERGKHAALINQALRDWLQAQSVKALLKAELPALLKEAISQSREETEESLLHRLHRMGRKLLQPKSLNNQEKPLQHKMHKKFGLKGSSAFPLHRPVVAFCISSLSGRLVGLVLCISLGAM